MEKFKPRHATAGKSSLPACTQERAKLVLTSRIPEDAMPDACSQL